MRVILSAVGAGGHSNDSPEPIFGSMVAEHMYCEVHCMSDTATHCLLFLDVAGGHSIDSPEPIFGLVVAGIVDPARVKRNSAAQAGDVLLLSKPLGVGVMTTALKKGLLPPEGYTEVCAVCLLELVVIFEVHIVCAASEFSGHFLL
jgi:selenophosphate synthase